MKHLVHNTFLTHSSQNKFYSFLMSIFLPKPAKSIIFSCLFAIGLVNLGWGQQSITTFGVANTQNFNGMGSSATAILPTGFKIGPDWSSGETETSRAYGTTGTGAVTGSSAGAAVNWANGVTASSTDRAVGFLNSGSYSSPRSIIYAFTNNTGQTITSILLDWNYEKYRSGSRAFDWTFFHGSTSMATTANSNGDYSSPADANNTVISNPPIQINRNFTIPGLSIANGTTYYLRWTYTGVGGSTNSQGFAIDDFSITIPLSVITSNQNGDWNTGSTWVGGNVPTAGATVVINHDVTLGTSLTNTGSVTVNSGASLAVGNGTYTNNGTTAINGGTFQINEGGFATGNNFSYSTLSTLVFNNSSGPYGPIDANHTYWPAINGPSNVTVQNGGGINMGVNRSVSGTFLLVTGTNAVQGNALTLNGNVRINGGNFLTTPIYGFNSTLIYNTGSVYGRNNEWNAIGVGTIASTPGYPYNVRVSNNTTLEFPNNSNDNRACARDLTIDNGSALYADYNGGSVNLTVGGNVSLGGNLSLGSTVGGDLTVKGNWTRTGGTFTPNGRAVFFNGSPLDQTITGATAFDFVILDKSTGNMVLNSDITVNQTLTLTNGLINTGANKVILPNSGNITKTNGWINGNLQRSVNNGNNRFDIGTASVYAPSTLNMSGVSGNVEVTGNLTQGSHPDEANSGIDVNKKANHYWTFTQSGGSFTSYTSTFDITNTTNTGNTADYKVTKYTNSAWSAIGGSTAGNEVTSATFTDFSDFIVGEIGCGTIIIDITDDNGLALDCTTPSTTLTASGGTSYLWSTTETTASITVSTGDTFIVTVTDSNGCTGVASVETTLDNTLPTASIINNTGTTELTCLVTSINVTATGGVSYVWDGGSTPNNANNTFSSAGSYNVTVTASNGCTSSESISITSNTTPPVAGITNNTGTTELTCLLTSINVTATGGMTYQWNGGTTPMTANNTFTTSGTYTVVVTASNGCVDTESISITQGDTPPTAVITNNTGTTVLTCSVTSIDVTASGGISYAWSGGSTPSTANNTFSSSGTYTVTVTASNGCEDTENITITSDYTTPTAGITNNIGTTELTCLVTSINVTATGGVSYVWDGGSTPNNANNTFSSAGSYNVTVTASNGCTSSESISITSNTTPPVAGITNNTGTTELTCLLTSINVTATGGMTYQWNGGTTPMTANNTFTTSGTYTVVVTASNGCIDTESISITQGDTPPTAVITNNTGTTVLTCSVTSIDVTASGGISYAWSGGSTPTTANNTFSSSGTYTVTVTASNGCEDTESITLTSNTITPTATIINNTGTTELTCLVASINVTATGGVSYVWDGGSTPNNANNTFSSASSYNVTVTASNGCTSSESISITSNTTPPVAGITNNTGTTELTCLLTSINVTATGGMTYQWNGGTTPMTANNTFTTSGTYTVVVTASNGCVDTESISITQGDTPPTAVITNNTGTTVLTCSVTSIDVTASGGISYAWSGGSTPTTANNTFSSAGTYTVTVTASNGCEDTENITITSDYTTPTAGITNNSGTTVLTCTLNSISVTATGGVSYLWDGGSTPMTANNSLTSIGTYTVTVTASNGCTDAESITITLDNTPPTAAITNNSGTSELTCAITSINVTATGGASYVWNGGATQITANNTFSTPNTYTVTVTAINGCTDTESITITLDNTPPLAGITNNSGTTELTCAVISISVTASGGSTYSWNGGATPMTANNTFVTSGTYTVTVTASNGCTDSESITITQDAGLPVVTCPENASYCYTEPTFSLAGGLPVGGDYSGAGVSANDFSASTAGVGTHTITYTYTNMSNCSASCTFMITVQEYTTIADGDFNDPTTWAGGCVPPNTIPAGVMVNIGHNLTNTGMITNNGTIMSTLPFTNEGTYQGSGTFQGPSFINNGTFKPGN